MFDFFFKKRVALKESPIVQLPDQKEKKEAIKQSKRESELSLAAGFAGQENDAVAFILKSQFADARFQAVMHIHSLDALTQVSRAMRNIDRRVSKLVQEKLTQLQNQQKHDLAVQRCIKHGQQLLKNELLTANQVAEWEKTRSVIHTPLICEESGLALLQVKTDLENRLHAQLKLQQQAIQLFNSLCSLTLPESELMPEQAQAHLVECSQFWSEIQSDALAASLPKTQINQINNQLVLAQSYVEQLARPVSVATPVEHVIQPVSHNEPAQSAPVDIDSLLVALEKALAEGSLQHALDLDKSFRNAANTTLPVRGDVAQRLHALRAELHRLLDWAKWGGHVSREELIKAAENLVTVDASAQLSPSEMVKQIGGLRAHWKELDKTGSSASTSIWSRFDGACNRAWRVADAHFKQKAQLRLDSFNAAQAQLLAIDTTIQVWENQLPDWKTQLAYINNAKLEWRKVGQVDRKFKAKLEAEFEQKCQLLLQPLTVAREAAIKTRLQLIRQVEAIAATDKSAADKVQQAQRCWQQESQSLSLERKDEQALWHQFRIACDAVFAQRKVYLEAQGQRRNDIMTAKQACCEELENDIKAFAHQNGAEVDVMQQKAKRRAQQTWRGLSAYSHSDLDTRFDAALKTIEQQHAVFLAGNKKIERERVTAKLKLCQQVEAVPAGSGEVAQWQAKWASLSVDSSSSELNQLTNQLTIRLTERFNNAMAALARQEGGGVEKSPANLGKITAQVEEQLLRMELLRGLPSPPEFMQQRLQLQVKEWQTALKNGEENGNYLHRLCALCALPLTLNKQQETRFQLILDDYFNQAIAH